MLEFTLLPLLSGNKAWAKEGKYGEEIVAGVGGGTRGNGGHHQWLSGPSRWCRFHRLPMKFLPAHLQKCIEFGLRGGFLSSFLAGSKAKLVFQLQGRSQIKRSWRKGGKGTQIRSPQPCLCHELLLVNSWTVEVTRCCDSAEESVLEIAGEL